MTVPTYDEMRANYVSLLEVERDQAVLEVKRCRWDIAARDRAIENLRAKFQARYRTPEQLAQLQAQVAETGTGLELMIGLYQTASDLDGPEAGLRELSELLDGMDHPVLAGFLIAAVALLAGETS